MRNRISALIIDPEYKSHDYSLITTEGDPIYGYKFGEHGFDLKILENTDDILKEINKFIGFDCMITIGDNINFAPLNALSFEFRKKWIHTKEFDPVWITRNIVNVFMYNLDRERDDNCKLFSIFTCTFNTPKRDFERLYNSLLNQTYRNWNWYILDDSTTPSTADMIAHYHDPRIVVIRNITNHGNIGFNKHLIASACNGDYLVEVDHDDELTSDCLELLLEAFKKYPDSDFVYSDGMEESGGKEVWYNTGFAYGLGVYRKEYAWGAERNIAVTPEINAISVRGIHALPNHVRCWKREFYHKIGGHNIELAVLDDMDLLIRTFLNGKMTKIEKVLYIQHEGESKHRAEGPTTQSKRFYEIQRTNEYLRRKYDRQIHKRIIELGYEDQPWIDDEIGSDIHYVYKNPDVKLPTLNNIFIP